MRRFLVAIAVLVGLFVPALGVQPDEILSDPALEQRAREISTELRCLVCQNQSIDDSDAPLARDLRILVRERLEAGDSDQEVVAFVVDRYGEFVLLNPRIGAHTIALWATPVVLLLLGGLAIVVAWRRRGGSASRASATVLSDDEKRRIDELLQKQD